MEKDRYFVQNFRTLRVYQLAFQSAIDIFTLSKKFPREEKYSLTDQVRRSSRSVCSNIAEGWYKRKYLAVFKNNLTDSLQEAPETQTWLEFSQAFGYIDDEYFEKLFNQYESIICMLVKMYKKAESFCQFS